MEGPALRARTVSSIRSHFAWRTRPGISRARRHGHAAMPLDHIVRLAIPFENDRQALIAQRVISVDPVLKAHEISVSFSASSAVLSAVFAGVSDRVIRVAISSCIDNIKTIIETMDEFDGERDTIWAKPIPDE